MALITRRGTGRFRCRSQKTDPGGVWSRLGPHGKALQSGEGEKLFNPSLYSNFSIQFLIIHLYSLS